MQFHRGRLTDHIHLRAKDLAATSKFYRAVIQSLGKADAIQEKEGEYFNADELWVDKLDANGHATHIHLAFMTADRAQVDAFYKAALAAGGKDNGPPGERKYHPGYYAAFVFDPDGNNIEAVYHGPFEKSAESVVYTAKKNV